MARGSGKDPAENILYGQTGPRGNEIAPIAQDWRRRMRMNEPVIWHHGPESPESGEPIRAFSRRCHPAELLAHAEDPLMSVHGVFVKRIPGSRLMDGKDCIIELEDGSTTRVHHAQLQGLHEVHIGDALRTVDGIGNLVDMIQGQDEYDLIFDVELDHGRGMVRSYRRDQLLLK